MKLLYGILIGVMLISCSSDDNIQQQLIMEELLVKGSPWTFSHYEIINIIDAGNSNFTQTEIENNINSSHNGTVLTFNKNGTGSVLEPPNEGTWKWRIVNNNQLEVTSILGDSEITENITV